MRFPVPDYWKHATAFRLARIATDVLAAPVFTPQSKKENLKAKYAITDVRNRYSDPF